MMGVVGIGVELVPGVLPENGETPQVVVKPDGESPVVTCR